MSPPSSPKRCGCGKRLKGKQRKWCSETCRRNLSYGGHCEICGAQPDGSGGPGRAPTRCVHHNLGAQHAAETYAKRQHTKRERVARLVRAGASDVAIAQELGTTVGTVGSFIHRLRAYGYELPYRGRPLPEPHPWRRPLD